MRRKYGSRFLKQNQDGTWSVAEEQAVRDKVSHSIRHALAKKQKSTPLPKTCSLDDIKNYNLHADAQDAETRKKISFVCDRQRKILSLMMMTTTTTTDEKVPSGNVHQRKKIQVE